MYQTILQLGKKYAVYGIAVLMGITLAYVAFADTINLDKAIEIYQQKISKEETAKLFYAESQYDRCLVESALAKTKLMANYAGEFTLTKADISRLEWKSKWTCEEFVPETNLDDKIVSKIDSVFKEYKSPLNAKEFVEACKAYPQEMCKTYIGMMYHESKLCTAFVYPNAEKDYFNCGGLKSDEILATHKADKNGSWLRKFDSYAQYYEIALGKFYNGYWVHGLRTPEQIVDLYVGKYSQNWVNSVYMILNKLK